MAPRLRVLAGPSPDALVPISVNTDKAHTIRSEYFEGKVLVYIKGFEGPDGTITENEYFERDDRKSVTWSIQVQGRFLQPRSADDILFGNTFDRPLKLPWGAGAAFKFMNFIDPTLEHDLGSHSQPWALSPLVSTMPHFVHTRVPSESSQRRNSSDDHARSPPPFPSKESVGDDTSQMRFEPKTGSPKRSLRFPSANKRRNFFGAPQNRQAVTFGPEDVVTTDFCYNFITFPDLHLSLPGGISFDLTKYWDGQPVRFVCCERPKKRRDGAGSDITGATPFWCVAIERVGED